eukprot:gene16692-25622_t
MKHFFCVAVFVCLAWRGAAAAKDLYFVTDTGLSVLRAATTEHLVAALPPGAFCNASEGLAVDEEMDVAVFTCGDALYVCDFGKGDVDAVPGFGRGNELFGVAVNGVDHVAYVAVLTANVGWTLEPYALRPCEDTKVESECNGRLGCAYAAGACARDFGSGAAIFTAATDSSEGGGVVVDPADNKTAWLTWATSAGAPKVTSQTNGNLNGVTADAAAGYYAGKEIGRISAGLGSFFVTVLSPTSTVVRRYQTNSGQGTEFSTGLPAFLQGHVAVQEDGSFYYNEPAKGLFHSVGANPPVLVKAGDVGAFYVAEASPAEEDDDDGGAGGVVLTVLAVLILLSGCAVGVYLCLRPQAVGSHGGYYSDNEGDNDDADSHGRDTRIPQRNNKELFASASDLPLLESSFMEDKKLDITPTGTPKASGNINSNDPNNVDTNNNHPLQTKVGPAAGGAHFSLPIMPVSSGRGATRAGLALSTAMASPNDDVDSYSMVFPPLSPELGRGGRGGVALSRSGHGNDGQLFMPDAHPIGVRSATMSRTSSALGSSYKMVGPKGVSLHKTRSDGMSNPHEVSLDGSYMFPSEFGSPARAAHPEAVPRSPVTPHVSQLDSSRRRHTALNASAFGTAFEPPVDEAVI